jgi:cullin-associated NEDD8-dissociated protein 1
MAGHISDDLVERLMCALLNGLRAALPASPPTRTYMQAIGSCSKSLGFRFAPFVVFSVQLMEHQIKAADANSSDVKETALLALACIAKACPQVCMDPSGACMHRYQASPRERASKSLD